MPLTKYKFEKLTPQGSFPYQICSDYSIVTLLTHTLLVFSSTEMKQTNGAAPERIIPQLVFTPASQAKLHGSIWIHIINRSR